MLKKSLESIKYKNNIYHEENQYLNLIDDILEENNEFEGRNGKTLSIFGSSMHFTLSNNIIPLLTTKKLAYKTCLKELLWFIKGSTDNNILNAQNLTDAHTCYKMFRSDIFLKIKLKEKGFSFCPEITTKIGLKKIKIKEIPIKYFGRGYDEGKKINFMDGIKAILTLIKYRFFA